MLADTERAVTGRYNYPDRVVTARADFRVIRLILIIEAFNVLLEKDLCVATLGVLFDGPTIARQRGFELRAALGRHQIPRPV